MRVEDLIAKRINKKPALFFVQEFLIAFPKGNLYLVGGAVRDAITGRVVEELDYDFVACGVEADDLEAWLQERGHVDLVGRDFGVFKFLPKEFTHETIGFIDIALPRTEASRPDSVGGYKEFDIQSDPNLPIEDDLSRRDFTINAMAFDVRSGELVDPHNGQRDLEQRVIETVGDPADRFNEDMSRMLRAVRFAAELHFELKQNVLEVIREKAQDINLMRERDGKTEYVVPRETVGLELAKALQRNPAGAVDWLQRSGLMKALLPEVQRIIDVDQNYLLPLTQVSRNCVTVATSLLLRALDSEQIRSALIHTGLSTLPKNSARRIDIQEQQWLISKLHPPLTKEDIAHMPAAEFEKWFFNGSGGHLLNVMRLIGHGEVVSAVLDRRDAIESRWAVERGEKIPPLISGDDLVSAGVPEGPKIRKLLEDCRSAQLMGELMSREDALEWMRARV